MDKQEEENLKNELIELQPTLLKYALSLTKNSELADDLVQDTNIKVLSKLNMYTLNTNFKGWVSTMMRNIFINNYRRNKLSPESTMTFSGDADLVPSWEGNAEDIPDQKIYVDRILQVRDSLPTSMNKIIRLRMDGFSYQEIANIEGVPIGTIKSRIYLARQIMKEQLPEYSEII